MSILGEPSAQVIRDLLDSLTADLAKVDEDYVNRLERLRAYLRDARSRDEADRREDQMRECDREWHMARRPLLEHREQILKAVAAAAGPLLLPPMLMAKAP